MSSVSAGRKTIEPSTSQIPSNETSWWLNQPIWNILVKMGTFPKQGWKIFQTTNRGEDVFLDFFWRSKCQNISNVCLDVRLVEVMHSWGHGPKNVEQKQQLNLMPMLYVVGIPGFPVPPKKWEKNSPLRWKNNYTNSNSCWPTLIPRGALIIQTNHGYKLFS